MRNRRQAFWPLFSLLLAAHAAVAAPKIITQPASLTVNAGSTAHLSVVASNAVSFQWYKGTQVITNATGADLIFENVSTTNTGPYRVAVKDAGGTNVFSATATLTVQRGTLVLFQFITGSTNGNVTVELFDHDKPATVQNFLNYVARGFYANTFMHRLEPGFVLQGGGYATTNRAAGGFLAAVTNNGLLDVASYAYNNAPGRQSVPFVFPGVGTFGFPVPLVAFNIPNEFSRGPLVHNTFGTLAMAKLGDFADSANSQWFFNLADNSANLDTNAGGFTVFGRVIQGLDTLNAFNALSTNSSIVNLDPFVPTNFIGAFPSLPFQTNGANPPNNADLYYANIKLLTTPALDRVKPAFTVTSPAANAKLTNGNFTIRGTASDLGSGLARLDASVYYDAPPLLGISYLPAITGTNGPGSPSVSNWFSRVSYDPGYYTVVFQAADGAGNTTVRLFSFEVLAPLQVNIAGQGSVSIVGHQTVSSPFAGIASYLELGAKYSMSATAKPGWFFASWDNGSITTAIPSISFTMANKVVTTNSQNLVSTNNLTFIANFVTNYFPHVLGIYNGLFMPTNGVAAGNSGFITLTPTATRGFTGSLMMMNSNYPFSGQFDFTGQAQTTVKRPGTNPVTLSLTLDLTNGTGAVGGTASNANWMASVLAYRAVTKLTTNTLPAADRFALLLPGAHGVTNLPGGDGVISVVAASTGTLTVGGTLSDNTAFTRTFSVSAQGWWPFYAPLYGGNGVLIGWQQFTSPSNSVGALNWVKPAVASAIYYPQGFSYWTNSPAQRYLAPLPTSLYQAIFDSATFAAPQANALTVNAGKLFAVSVPNTDQLKITSFVPTTGALSGQLTPPGFVKPVLFQAEFFNPTAGGFGFILDPTNHVSGWVNLEPQ